MKQFEGLNIPQDIEPAEPTPRDRQKAWCEAWWKDRKCAVVCKTCYGCIFGRVNLDTFKRWEQDMRPSDKFLDTVEKQRKEIKERNRA